MPKANYTIIPLACGLCLYESLKKYGIARQLEITKHYADSHKREGPPQFDSATWTRKTVFPLRHIGNTLP